MGRLLVVLLVIAVLVAIVVLIVIAVTAGKRPVERSTAPVTTVHCRITSKRTMLSRGGRATDYFATFEEPDGSRTELHVDPVTYGHLSEGDRGWLTAQGERYLSFVREVEIRPPDDQR